ncbi:hypothetical protein WICPIJ_004927 [Wickerhamomyces pijperi]|uniref:triacylglycerol lipase n=1 Tax=Wickerhamomyces pijperi TaxID=599730 RepID=A0A9P8Q4J1_WICPI|nr:hypothetical protein WICPIJ_004927 [Wickerhamomyces pijperi]
MLTTVFFFLLCAFGVFIPTIFCHPTHNLNPDEGPKFSSSDSDLLHPTPISPALYADLISYSKLIDISYCISPWSRIQFPFQCDGDCSEFHRTELIYQWNSNDFTRSQIIDARQGNDFSTTGYIAVSHDLKSIVVSLRGTRSFKDSLINLNTDMIPYRASSANNNNMWVHRGFYFSYLDTWERIKWHIALQISKFPQYQLLVLGHSMGGAIANFVTLRIVEEGIKVQGHVSGVLGVSMGQPMIGNSEFSNYVNQMLNLSSNWTSLSCQNQPKFIRVTHKHDPVVKLPFLSVRLDTSSEPRSSTPGELNDDNLYSHCNGEIYINEVGSEVPLKQNVYHCEGNHDQRCSNDGTNTGLDPRDNTEHLNYFKRLGTCGFSL